MTVKDVFSYLTLNLLGIARGKNVSCKTSIAHRARAHEGFAYQTVSLHPALHIRGKPLKDQLEIVRHTREQTFFECKHPNFEALLVDAKHRVDYGFAMRESSAP